MIQADEDLERWRSLALDAIVGSGRALDTRHRLAVWAHRLLERAGQHEPPIDLHAVAAQLKARVELADISGRGMLLDLEREPVIFIQKASSPAVQRFSIAHECAHLVFRRAIEKRFQDPDLVSRLHKWGASPQQERLCDLLASELLMPEPLVRRILASSPRRGLRLASVLAEAFGVSRVAALRRLIDLGEPYLLVVWRRTSLPNGEVKFRVAWCDRPAKLGVGFISTDVSAPSDSPVPKVAKSRVTQSQWTALGYLNVGPGTYRCDLMPFGGDVLFVADLGSRRESARD
jgi:hypothetical protein